MFFFKKKKEKLSLANIFLKSSLTKKCFHWLIFFIDKQIQENLENNFYKIKEPEIFFILFSINVYI
jgi:hypothetical protein